MDKERKKVLRRRLGFYAIRIFTSLSAVLPLKADYFIGRIFGNITYWFILRHRRIALESLSIAFPDLSSKKRKNIARKFFIFMAQGSLELLHILKNLDKLQDIDIEGIDNLKNSLAKKRGAIILTAHIGNFPLMCLKLVKSGFPTNIVIRPMRDKLAGDYLHSLRAEAGVKTIFSYPRRECVSNIIRALRDNEVVIMLMDQNFGTGGVWVNFFDKLAATPTGPVILALRTKAAIVPAYMFCKDNHKHHLKILPEQELILKEDKDETVFANVVRFTRMIEGWIRGVDYQWSWIHRRWKSRPSEKMKSSRFKVEK